MCPLDRIKYFRCMLSPSTVCRKPRESIVDGKAVAEYVLWWSAALHAVVDHWDSDSKCGLENTSDRRRLLVVNATLTHFEAVRITITTFADLSTIFRPYFTNKYVFNFHRPSVTATWCTIPLTLGASSTQPSINDKWRMWFLQACNKANDHPFEHLLQPTDRLFSEPPDHRSSSFQNHPQSADERRHVTCVQ